MSVHGTARWATAADVRAADLLSNSGMFAGYWVEKDQGIWPLRYNGDLHQLIVGGTGGGKFTTAIAPFLFGSELDDQAVVVVDPKGEIAQATGPFFQQAFASKRNVFLLDPWDEAGTGSTAALNFLSLITADNPNHVDDARALADAMILSSGAENQHWDNAARNYLASVLLYVALDPKEASRRDLIRVREIVTLPFQMPKAYQGKKQETLSEILFASMDSELAGGAIKRGFRALLNREEREQSGIISSVERDTAWIDSPQMARVLRGQSLDMREAATGSNKYFVIIPPDFFMTHRFWLRLCVTAFAKAFRRYRSARTGANRWRHIVIDEFANLGEMTFVLNDIAVSRGYDVKYTLAVQDFSQLARVYNQGWESFINNSFQRFFAVSDMFTAEYVSRMTGYATVESISQSVSENTGQSFSNNVGNSVSRGSSVPMGPGNVSSTSGITRSDGRGYTENYGTSRSHTYNQVQRPLATPDEVRRMPSYVQYVFFRGLHPMQSYRPPYWEDFSRLPNFSLNEVLGTIGRSPRNEAERVKFLGWRQKPLYLHGPQEKAVEKPSFPPPGPGPAGPGTQRTSNLGEKVQKVVLWGCVALLAYWIWSAWFSPTPRPRPVEQPIQQAPISQTPPHVSVPPPISVQPAPAPPPATPAKPMRPSLPNRKMVNEMPQGAKTRDYLLQLMRDQVNFCAIGKGNAEQLMMERLAEWIRRSGPVFSKTDPAIVKQYQAQLEPYLSRSGSWSRRDREAVFDLLLRALKDQPAGFPIQTAQILNRFYAQGGCPFDTVPEADYQLPGFGPDRTMFP